MTFSECLGRDKFQIAVVLVLFALLYTAIVPDMVRQWYTDDNYSHGFIVPFVAAYFLYLRRADLLSAEVSPSWGGMLVILAGVLQLIVAWLGSELFTMRSSMIVILIGLTLFLFGKEVFTVCKFPLLYLFLMIPIPYIIYDAVAFPLKLFVTKISVAFLKLVGIIVLREGNIIMFPSITLEVADACSGIRSLMSLVALSVAFAYCLDISTGKRLALILSAVPIAIITNAARVIITGILAQWFGAKAAEGFFHEFAGLAIFALALVLLIGLGAVLNRKRISPI